MLKAFSIQTGTQCLQYEEPTRDPALWSAGSVSAPWIVQTARDPDVFAPLTAGEQR